MIIKILGNGVWGNALYSVISQNTSSVSFLGKEEFSENQDILILAIPVQSIRSALKFVSFAQRKKIIINTGKGIERGTHKMPEQIVKEIMGDDVEYYSLIGPSFAQEVVDKMPTLVNIAYNEFSDTQKQLKHLFQTDYFHVRFTKGVASLELSSAFKNIYAIVCGLSAGLGYGMNTRVELIVFAIEEFRMLCEKMRLHLDTAATIGTTGDLILTCNSIESRNFMLGKYMAEFSVEESLEKVKSTVEGFHSLDSIDYFEKKSGISLPLASFVRSVVEINNPAIIGERFQKFIVDRAVQESES